MYVVVIFMKQQAQKFCKDYILMRYFTQIYEKARHFKIKVFFNRCRKNPYNFQKIMSSQNNLPVKAGNSACRVK